MPKELFTQAAGWMMASSEHVYLVPTRVRVGNPGWATGVGVGVGAGVEATAKEMSAELALDPQALFAFTRA